MNARVLRDPRDRFSLRYSPRSLTVAVALSWVLLVVGIAALTTGDYPLSPTAAIATVFGHGDPAGEFIIHTLRLPRLLTAVLVGAALGISGAILQSLSRNPLASPDIVGFTTGSATGGIFAVVVMGGSMAEIAAGAVLGGLLTSVLVYALAFRAGAHGFRVILIGIGVGSMLLSVNSYLISRASLTDAMAASAWLVGGLNGRGWEQAVTGAVALAVAAPLLVAYGRRLAVLEMGDDAATALGVDGERSRLVLVAISVGLAAAATAAAGPVAFVALIAPQLARRLVRAASPVFVSAAVMGAVLLAAGDLAIQRIFSPAQLPVGIATAALGGLYLVWLLGYEWRKGRL